MGSVSNQQFAGGCAKAGEAEPTADSPGPEEEEEEGSQPLLRGAGICKWFNVRMGFGFLAMTARDGVALEAPVDVFVHQTETHFLERHSCGEPTRSDVINLEVTSSSRKCCPCALLYKPVPVYSESKLHMEGFRSLKEGEAVEFTFKKSSKGLESIRVTGPGGVFCIGSERRPKGKNLQKRRSKGDRCYNCGGLDHHAKECKLPPQPKKCHFCQSTAHMVANCPVKTQQSPGSQGKPAYFREEEEMHSSPLLPETRE